MFYNPDANLSSFLHSIPIELPEESYSAFLAFSPDFSKLYITCGSLQDKDKGYLIRFSLQEDSYTQEEGWIFETGLHRPTGIAVVSSN